MFLELIAVIVAGIAGAGVMMLVSKISGGQLPRWLVPVAAGCAMLAAAISSEYGWYGRISEALPDGLVVADRINEPSWYRPWTYVVPMTQRFVAVDIDNLQQNTERNSVFLADLYFFGRWRPVQSVEVMVDCAENLRADPTFGDGSPPVWRDVGPADPILSAICRQV
ncbi:hypothetical protein SAMN05421759_12623 [Roseivivax lentus]|uniref:Uncharacterized protein n=1 Tax=Roseivivax lentus TaxID=633194 RepID=A0A1N7Q3H7_9RHOB|nr:hypothetical protein [Roseivivax lentus]SIT17400.1 hypothetical protein SAMN05421759_12623 [Roseivivax lentus]